MKKIFNIAYIMLTIWLLFNAPLMWFIIAISILIIHIIYDIIMKDIRWSRYMKKLDETFENDESNENEKPK